MLKRGCFGAEKEKFGYFYLESYNNLLLFTYNLLISSDIPQNHVGTYHKIYLKHLNIIFVFILNLVLGL